MNESDLDFVNWWWLEQERQRLARSGRIRQSKLELYQLWIESAALARSLENELERARRPMPARPKPERTSPWPQQSALVRSLGLGEKVMHRSFTFERADAANDKNRTVVLTVSSDAPYERSFGTEILDHSPSSIRMDRFLKGAPLLFNHDPNAHLGRIVSSRTDGKKLSVRAKFGSSALAREKYQDVADGVLREASIGYVIFNMVESKRGSRVFRATDWEPYEGSLVTIPADPSCGVGRSFP